MLGFQIRSKRKWRKISESEQRIKMKKRKWSCRTNIFYNPLLDYLHYWNTIKHTQWLIMIMIIMIMVMMTMIIDNSDNHNITVVNIIDQHTIHSFLPEKWATNGRSSGIVWNSALRYSSSTANLSLQIILWLNKSIYDKRIQNWLISWCHFVVFFLSILLYLTIYATDA